MNIEIEMENGGIIKAELYPDVAPITVENFVSLIERNFFDGLIFHRVIPGFMIQGGGFTADGQHKETDSIKGEFDGNGVTNPLKHTRGVLSMARTMFPNSASVSSSLCTRMHLTLTVSMPLSVRLQMVSRLLTK